MQISIKNFRGISHAAFNLAKITLIGGHNAAGKSSIAQATAALLTGNATPVRGVTKSTSGQLVRSGTAAGAATLTDGDNTTEISWPKAQVKTTGQPPQATEFAAGLSCVLNLNAKDRAAALSAYLQAEPTRDDFNRELKRLDLPDTLMDELWKIIEHNGWDSAHANCKEKGAKLKGQWEQITGENYGSKKADSYIPEGWEPELEGLSEDSLEDALSDARQVLEGCIAVEAIDDAKREELEQRAEDIQAIKEHIEVLTQKISDLDAQRDEAHGVKAKLPPAKWSSHLTCPKCSEPLELYNGELRHAEVIPEAELKKRAEDIGKATSIIDGITSQINDVSGQLADAKADLRKCQEASAELEKMDKQQNAESGDIDAARTAMQNAESRLKAWKQKTQADNRHMNIQLNAELVKALAPTGIRQVKLAEALGSFNGQLATMSETSGFGVAEIDSDLNASLNGTPYYLLSKSERWRVRVLIQVVMAWIDSSAVVVIDGADILVDGALRNGLFSLLAGVDIPALTTMALRDVDAPRYGLPDLSAVGIGESYWIDNGVLKARADVVGGK